MKNIKKIILIVIAILLIVVVLKIILTKTQNNNESNQNENLEANIDTSYEVDKNQISYQEDVTIDELKEEIGATGDTEIYEIQQEFDGRNIITVKAGIKYKVAFAGMIKKEKPEMDELDNILTENSPLKTGIWVEEQSRKRILELFNNKEVNSEYSIDDDGYLQIKNKNNQNETDKELEKIINGNKQYILNISSVCYIVDDITGEILDYNFENMDKYQVYEYFEDEDKNIIFINQNTEGQLSNSEIFNSIVELLNI